MRYFRYFIFIILIFTIWCFYNEVKSQNSLIKYLIEENDRIEALCNN